MSFSQMVSERFSRLFGLDISCFADGDSLFLLVQKKWAKKYTPVSVLIFALANFYGQFVNSLRSNTTNWPWNLHANAQALKMGELKQNAGFLGINNRTLVISQPHYFCLECVREFLCSICLVWGAKRRVTNWVRKLGLSSRTAKVQVLSFASVFFAPAKTKPLGFECCLLATVR